MTKSILRSVRQTLVRLINLSLAAIIGLSSLVAATPLIFSASASALSNTLEVGAGQPYSTIQSAINAASSGDTINVATGTYTENVIVSKPVTLIGALGAKLVVVDGTSSNGFSVSANNVTIRGFDIEGPVSSSYKTYSWGSNISRGIVINNGVTGFTITNNTIQNLRNDILIDGRNTGSVTNNVIDNSKSGISVQYTDGSGITITGNNQGTYGNDWGINLHLNGNFDGTTIHSNPYPGGSAPTSAQTIINADSSANSGWTVQDQAYVSSNRTAVTVATTGTANAQGDPLSPIDTIQNGVNAVVSGGTVNVATGTYNLSSELDITKPVSIIGQGVVTIKSANASWDTTNNGKHILGIYAGTSLSPVSISNVTIDSNSQSYGVNTYANAYGVLDGVTIKNSKGAALTVNGSTITATDLNTSGNSWGAVNVDPGSSAVTLPSVFTLNSGTLSDSTQIWSDGRNVVGTATVTVNAQGYSMYHEDTTGHLWTNRALTSLTNTAMITKNGVTNLYSTIQGAINAAVSGDTINVAAGTYNESPNITTSVTLQSTAGRDVTTIKSLTVATSGVTVNGFTIQGVNASGVPSANVFLNSGVSNVTVSNNNINVGSGADDNGIGILTTYDLAHIGDNINVTGNIFKALDAGSNRAFYVNPGVNHFTFSGNTISGNFTGTAITQAQNGLVQNNTVTGVGAVGARSAGLGTWGYPDPTIWGHTTFTGNTISGTRRAVSVYETNNVTINGNNLSGNGIGVWVGDATPLTFDATTISISNNNLGSEDTFGVDNTMATNLNATLNYWGSIHPAFNSIISGNVSYIPWYTNTIRTVLSNKLPVISLVGDSSLKIYQGTTYTDAGATATDNQGDSLTVVTTNLPDTTTFGTYTVHYNATDSFNNSATEVTRTVQVLKKEVTQTVIAPTNTVSSTSPQIVIGFNAPTNSTITVPAGVTNASLDVAAILTTNSSGSKTATLSGGIDVKATTSAGQVTVALPAGTTITGAAGWDGTVNLPKIVNTTVTLPAKAGSTPTSVSSIEVGFGDVALNFSQPVRLLFAGKAGKQVGWSRSGVFSLITAVCTSDSVSGMPAGANECKIDSGADMAVWTKHFTTFTTYAQSPTYKVVAGDTLFSIGARASVDWRLIASDNNINFPYVIYPGQVLALPDGTVVAAASKVTTAQVSAPSVLGATSSPQVGTAISTVVGKTAVATSTAKANWFNWNWFYAGASIVLLAVIYYAYIAADKKNKS